eukprot:gene21423-60574_t
MKDATELLSDAKGAETDDGYKKLLAMAAPPADPPQKPPAATAP